MDNEQFKIINIQGDGNFLFRSLSYGLYKNQNRNTEVRKNIVQFTLDNWTKYKELLDMISVERIYKNRDEYYENMIADKTYDTDFDIATFIHLYKKGICMYRETKGKITFVQTLDPKNKKCKASAKVSYINLLFGGEQRSGHFDVLEDIQGTPADEQISDISEKLSQIEIQNNEQKKVRDVDCLSVQNLSQQFSQISLEKNEENFLQRIEKIKQKSNRHEK